MIDVYAAIDILDGRCVRLQRGDVSNPTDYGDPVEMAERWESAGCDWLHVVDLDGAIRGEPVNIAKISAIIGTASVPVQLGGGLREPTAVESALAAGCERVVLGSAAIRDPDLAAKIVQAHRGRVSLALDVKGGEVAVEGWTKGSGYALEESAARLRDIPFASVVVTDVTRDGLMTGVNLEVVEAVLDWAPWPVVISGGVASSADAEAVGEVARTHPRGHKLTGIIVGRALYEGAVTIAEIKTALEG